MKCILFLSLVLLATGCITSLFNRGYDSRRYHIVTLNLFNQRTPPMEEKPSWQSDWIYRRQRLSLIDEELRAHKPDILVVQEAMEKDGSPMESDLGILQAGVLVGYDIQKFVTLNYDDEREFLGFAAVEPFKVLRHEDADPFAEPDAWALAEKSYAAAAIVTTDDQPLVVVNANIASNPNLQGTAYQRLSDLVRRYLELQKICSRRLIIAGVLPPEISPGPFTALMNDLGLIDTSADTCEIDANCNAGSFDNELFRATADQDQVARVVRIISHQESRIEQNTRIMNLSANATPEVSAYGFSKLNPTRLYGWSTRLQPALCDVHE